VTPGTIQLDTADGLALAADLVVPAQCRGGAAVAHPHPLFGGDRRNPVVRVLADALEAADLAVVTFDFRGVGASQGVHDDGDGERLDLLAALESVAAVAGGPLIAAGYSFGAGVALDVADPRLTGWLLVAPPLTPGTRRPLAGFDPRPKWLIVPEHDQFCPPDAARAATASWASTSVAEVPGTDHFLAGRSATVADLVAAALASLLP
jgi:alpha/beta superfamily hydrolase